MSRCELTGKGPVVKNLVSHSNIKTKSISQPNIQEKRLFSKVLNQMIRLKVASSAIKSMEHRGGFDQFVLGQPNEALSPKAQTIRNRIRRAMKAKKT
jgi:large subunit ribosomal protein L28